MSFTGVKVFSATKPKQRNDLGESVTRWIQATPTVKIVDKVVRQSSDDGFHCLTIAIFYERGGEEEDATLRGRV